MRENLPFEHVCQVKYTNQNVCFFLLLREVVKQFTGWGNLSKKKKCEQANEQTKPTNLSTNGCASPENLRKDISG